MLSFRLLTNFSRGSLISAFNNVLCNNVVRLMQSFMEVNHAANVFQAISSFVLNISISISKREINCDKEVPEALIRCIYNILNRKSDDPTIVHQLCLALGTLLCNPSVNLSNVTKELNFQSLIISLSILDSSVKTELISLL